jgi:hypothetical protein
MLWAAYPEDHAPCDQNWDNQCAIRMSIALQGAGFRLVGYTEPQCKHGHARGAESLAQFLVKRFGRPIIKKDGSAAQAAMGRRSGIVFFKDITGFRGGYGDHMDLWDGSTTKTGAYFGVCRQVWFWPLN